MEQDAYRAKQLENAARIAVRLLSLANLEDGSHLAFRRALFQIHLTGKPRIMALAVP